MSFTPCWYRPRLDAFGAWPAWSKDGDVSARLASALDDAGQSAEAQLKEYYWAFAHSYGAGAHARALGTQATDRDTGVEAAWTIAALDYFSARVHAPRPWIGGITNPRNHTLWRRLEPYLANRLIDLLTANATESFVWRAIVARLPSTGVMLNSLERAFERRLRDQNDSSSGAYRSVKVALDLKLSTPGVDGWIAERLPRELEAIEASIAQGRPALVELICDPSAAPMVELVTVYHVERREDGAWRLVWHEPGGKRYSVVTVRIEAEGACFASEGGFRDRPAPRALRCWRYAAASPPLFGPRRWLRRVLPWRSFWYGGRAMRLLLMRRP